MPPLPNLPSKRQHYGTGTATAYAGSNITGAQVSYRVKRLVRFPGWYYWRHPYFKDTPQEIAHGETVTDASGQYKIDFKALPDTSVSKENLPTFQYEVTADVTDINGETHTATRIVSVGYHALTANIDVPNRLDKDKKADTLRISTLNLNGQSVATKGTLAMYKLQAPDQVLRPRPWEAPDYTNWERGGFKELFPHDAFADEYDPTTWKRGKPVWETDFNTGKATYIELPILKKWASGKYLIVLETKDKFGQDVKALAQTALYSDSDKKLADHQLFQIRSDKETYAVGDKVVVTIASASRDLSVSVFVEKDNKLVGTHIIALNDSSSSFTVPVTSDDVGGFAINYSFSAYNSFQSGSLPIAVPYPKTELEIETLTFRDKLEPGTDETWSFRIKGPKGDKVSAELLASMYDASLDAFREHAWSFDPLMRTIYYPHFYINAGPSYGVSPFRTYLDNDPYHFSPQRYDSFNWFGFYFGNNRYRLTQSMKMNAAAPEENIEGVNAESDMVESPFQKILEGKAAGIEILRPGESTKETYFNEVKIRKNLQETAFFFPQLKTDGEGNVSFNFTTPEALTQWKLQLLAHTKSLESAVTTLQTVTQKELMVIPNAPRFLREGDEINYQHQNRQPHRETTFRRSKTGVDDAVTNEDISKKLLIAPLHPEKMPKTKQHGKKLRSRSIRWATPKSLGVLKIPDGLQAVQYKVIAKAGDYSDGEQNLLPVLTNRMLVTETLPMWVRSNQTKTFHTR